jgi:hypothetical protein
MTGRGADSRRKIAPLARVFVARFFENELTGGGGDLRQSFFWLIAFLAPIGFMLPWLRMFDYQSLHFRGGPELLHKVVMGDVAFYLSFSMVAAGIVATIVWQALLIDRRDVLVLGVLPLESAHIVVAKILALGIYVGLIAAGAHVAAGATFGMMVGNWEGLLSIVHIAAAFVVTSSLATAFVFGAVTAIQGALLAITGPRVFARLSGWLQLATAAAVLGLLLGLPTITSSAVSAMTGSPVVHWAETACEHPLPGWVIRTPPLWFLGLYEVMLGAGSPLASALSRVALSALAMVTVITIGSYGLAYRRLMRAAVEEPPGAPRARRLSFLTLSIPIALARRPVTRAVVQFLLATMGRVERHRLVLAVASGAAVALSAPSVVAAWPFAGSLPGTSAMAIPLVFMLLALAGLRVVAALPGDVRANWIFTAIQPSAAHTKAGTWRVMLVLGVLPPVLIWLAIASVLWGFPIAITHATLSASVGVLTVEVLLMRADGPPCGKVWRPERARLRKRWPLYLLAFLVVTQGVPRLSLALVDHPAVVLALACGLLGVTSVLRAVQRRARPVQEEEDEPLPVQLLNLE